MRIARRAGPSICSSHTPRRTARRRSSGNWLNRWKSWRTACCRSGGSCGTVRTALGGAGAARESGSRISAAALRSASAARAQVLEQALALLGGHCFQTVEHGQVGRGPQREAFRRLPEKQPRASRIIAPMQNPCRIYSHRLGFRGWRQVQLAQHLHVVQRLFQAVDIQAFYMRLLGGRRLGRKRTDQQCRQQHQRSQGQGKAGRNSPLQNGGALPARSAGTTGDRNPARQPPLPSRPAPTRPSAAAASTPGRPHSARDAAP